MNEKDLLCKIVVRSSLPTCVKIQYSLFSQNSIKEDSLYYQYYTACSKTYRISLFRNPRLSFIERFQDYDIEVNHSEISNINDKNSILKLTKYLKNYYDVLGGLDYINVYFQDKYMALRAIQSIPILISRRRNMDWSLRKAYQTKYKEFIQSMKKNLTYME